MNILNDLKTHLFLSLAKEKAKLSIALSTIIFTLLFWLLSLSIIPVFHVVFISTFVSYWVGFSIILINNYDKKYFKYLIITNLVCNLIFSILVATFAFAFNNFLPKGVTYILSLILYSLFAYFISTLFKKEELDNKKASFETAIKKIFTFNSVKVATIIIVIIWGLVAFWLCYNGDTNSDLSVMTFMANDIISGNTFLSGWILSKILFVATDLLPYYFFASLFGLSKFVDIFSTWFMLFSVFLLGLAILKKSPKYNFIYFIFYVITTLVLMEDHYTNFFKIHTMATVYGLVVLLLFDYFNKTHKKKIVVMIILLMILASMSDKTFIAYFAFEIFIFYSIRIFQCTSKRKLYLTMTLLILLSIGLGLAGEKIFCAIGGCNIGSSRSLKKLYFVPIGKWPRNFLHTFNTLVQVSGGNLESVEGLYVFKNILAIMFIVAFVISSLYIIVKIIKNGQEKIIQFSLALSFYVMIGIFVVTSTLEIYLSMRYYQSFIIIGAINIIFALQDIKFKFKKIPVLNISVAFSLITLVTNIYTYKNLFTIPKKDIQLLADTLVDLKEKYHLYDGFACFWIADDTTIKTHNQVHVRAVEYNYSGSPVWGVITRSYYYENESWYTNDNVKFNFIITANLQYYRWDFNITTDNVVSLLGDYTENITVKGTEFADQFNILIYNYDISTKVYGCIHYINN